MCACHFAGDVEVRGEFVYVLATAGSGKEGEWRICPWLSCWSHDGV